MRTILTSLVLSLPLAKGAVTRGPYLQMAHAEGVTVVWRADQDIENPAVRFWQEGQVPAVCAGRSVLVRTQSGDAALSVIPAGQKQYEATILGLKANTIYRYALFDGTNPLADDTAGQTFTTHPAIGEEKSARIWVVGDSGTGELHQRLVHRAMLNHTKAQPIDLYLHVGDMAYGQGTDAQFQEKFFQPYQSTLRSTVCWASLGNHEGQTSNGKTETGPFYDAYVCPTQGEAGGVPSGSESFYSFDYGRIHFICLDSYDIDRTPEGAMAKWLVRDLEATRAKWIIGFWHHPPYTKGTHDSDTEIELVEMRKHIMPILEAGGVDLVLAGHSHIYERSMLIDGAYQTPTTAIGVVLDDGDGDPTGDGPYVKPEEVKPHKGTVAVVTGHGGALGRNSMGVMPIMRSIVLDHGSTIIDVSGDTLDGTMLDLAGKVRDRFQIVKKGKTNPQVLENPWIATRDTEERTGAGVLGSPSSKESARQAREAGETAVARDIPQSFKYLIPKNARWDYLADGGKPETEMWTKLGFDSNEEGWKNGTAGFGYGDSDDRTVLKDMEGKYDAVFIRREFEIPDGTDLSKLGLVINYDDGFILHINGKEIFSKAVQRVANGSLKVTSHESSGSEYFSLREFTKVFVPGKNIIAIEGYNTKLTSSDFSLDPYLVEDTSKVSE